jgi:hypothetical protein
LSLIADSGDGGNYNCSFAPAYADGVFDDFEHDTNHVIICSGHMFFDCSALVIGLFGSFMSSWGANDRCAVGMHVIEREFAICIRRCV